MTASAGPVAAAVSGAAAESASDADASGDPVSVPAVVPVPDRVAADACPDVPEPAWAAAPNRPLVSAEGAAVLPRRMPSATSSGDGVVLSGVTPPPADATKACNVASVER